MVEMSIIQLPVLKILELLSYTLANKQPISTTSNHCQTTSKIDFYWNEKNMNLTKFETIQTYLSN